MARCVQVPAARVPAASAERVPPPPPARECSSRPPARSIPGAVRTSAYAEGSHSTPGLVPSHPGKEIARKIAGRRPRALDRYTPNLIPHCHSCHREAIAKTLVRENHDKVTALFSEESTHRESWSMIYQAMSIILYRAVWSRLKFLCRNTHTILTIFFTLDCYIIDVVSKQGKVKGEVAYTEQKHKNNNINIALLHWSTHNS